MTWPIAPQCFVNDKNFCSRVVVCVKGLLYNLLWSITSQVRGGGGSLVSVYGWKGFFR